MLFLDNRYQMNEICAQIVSQLLFYYARCDFFSSNVNLVVIP